ncbi:MAG: Nucleoside-diphosphate-sugar pyrophosphorylase family protein [Bacteroidetes bacterium]|nr:Nucleoside-diphosphate-sugar pyrophosphorylase family protein [Bacteroidota bacterium]
MKPVDFLIGENQTAKEALSIINNMALPDISLFVKADDASLSGALTEGDIRRGLLAGKTLSQSVKDFMRKDFKYFEEQGNSYDIFRKCKALRIRFVPVLNPEKQLVDVCDLNTLKSYLPASVLLMAGGLGERLRPLTDEIPKPLLKVGDKAIIDYNIENLQKHGIRNFHISLKYKADMLAEHLSKSISFPSNVSFIRETDPRGTAGSLSELKDVANEYVILMNSDLLTNVDFSSLYDKLQSSGADLVMATIPYNIDVPYAIVEVDDADRIHALTEKPRYTYYANAGIYLMKKDMIRYVPDAGKFDATDLTELLIKNGRKVVSQPILGYWLDIGRHEDFAKAQNDIKYLQF